MKFVEIQPLQPTELASCDPVNAVCDYDPDINASVDYWQRFKDGTENPVKIQLAEVLGTFITEGLTHRRQILEANRRLPVVPMAALLGCHAMTKLMEEQWLIPGDASASMEDSEARANPDLTAFILDMLDAPRPRLHIEPGDIAEASGMRAPELGQELWFRKGELTVRAQRPADITQDMYAMHERAGIVPTPESLVSLFPMLQARSTKATHRCTSKIAFVIGLGDKE